VGAHPTTNTAAALSHQDPFGDTVAILRVAQLGHPILRQVAAPVKPEDLSSPEFQRLCDDMLETMDEYDGAGLAAPQVHVSLRVVVCALSRERPAEFFINPVITPLTDELSASYEGCLSVEGLRGRVERPNHVRVEAFDRDGSAKEYVLKGFPATVIQHECDHLDGVLYIDRADPRSLAFLAEYRRHGPLVTNPEDYDDDEEGEEYEGEDDDLDEEIDDDPNDPTDEDTR
jgi:peptide deformylase